MVTFGPGPGQPMHIHHVIMMPEGTYTLRWFLRRKTQKQRYQARKLYRRVRGWLR
jgi:hypothetical protein